MKMSCTSDVGTIPVTIFCCLKVVLCKEAACCVYCFQIVENASQNAGKVSTLDRQKLGNYSAGPCEFCSSINTDV